MSSGVRGPRDPDETQNERLDRLERERQGLSPVPETWQEKHAAHDQAQDAQMARALVSIAALTDQMAEVIVAQHRAARDMADRSHEISEIRETVKHNATVAKEVLELFETLKGGFKVLGWLGVFAKGIAGLVAAALAVWAGWEKLKHGIPPKP